MSTIESLPNDIIRIILLELDPASIVRLGLTSTKWFSFLNLPPITATTTITAIATTATTAVVNDDFHFWKYYVVQKYHMELMPALHFVWKGVLLTTSLP